MEPMTVLLVIALLAGIYMAWSIGANDVANAMGTSVGSHALSINQAIFVAAVFEFVGAFLAGEQVTNTIKQGIVDPTFFVGQPLMFAFGMTAALVSTAAWLQFASARGLPVSTTHSIIGAVIGFGAVSAGPNAVDWAHLLTIIGSWCVSPVTGAIVSYVTFLIIRRYVLDSRNPLSASRKWVPILMFAVVTTIFIVFLHEGLQTLKVVFGDNIVFVVAILVGCLAAIATSLLIRWKIKETSEDREVILTQVERIFAWMQTVTACCMALAHGSNDVANAIGPIAGVLAVVKEGAVVTSSRVPYWLLGLGGIGIVIGLATYGRRVIETIGTGITEITPTRGFAAEFGASLTILVGSSFGMPLSTTQVLVGSVIGVGLARGIAGLNLVVIRRIVSSWLVTIPITCVLSGFLCFLVELALGRMN